MINKRLINTGEAVVPFDPLQNFETVTYTGNGGTQKITGYIRKGGAFNGSSSKVDLPNFMPSGNASRSISMWIKTTTTAYSSLFRYGAGTTNNYFLFRVNTGTHLGVAFYANDYDVDVSSTNLFDGNWHQVAMTYDGTTIRLYVDGAEQGSGYNAGSTNTTASAGRLGYQANPDGSSAGSYFNGSIDQVRIFDKALSSSEVTTLYGETYASSTKSTTDIFGDGSGVALYELDEDANDTGTVASTIDTVDIFGDSSLTDYYKLDGGLTNEKSGGTSLQSGSSTFGSGILGQALYLNGSQTASQTSTSYGSMNITGSYSISFYFKATVGSKRNLIWYHGNNNGYNNQIEYGGDNRLYFGAGTITSQTYPSGYWYHITASLNSSNGLITAYVNGQLIGSRTAPIVGADPTQCFGHGAVGLTGYIDQVRIFNKIISDSEAATLYEVTSYEATPTNVNFLGMAFQPDFVWIKPRSYADNHNLFDSIRGATKQLISNNTSAESTQPNTLQSFDSNGFTTGPDNNTNINGSTYVAWCWKAGGTAVSNTDGNVTTTVSANVDAGFSIVKYFGGNISNTYGHGLDSAPELIIIKNLDTVRDWSVVGTALGGDGGDRLVLNDTVAKITTTGLSGTTATTFAFEHNNSIANSAENFIAYCFHSVDSYQKVGSYTGTGAPGNVVTTGFRPRFVMYKNTGLATAWVMIDSVRGEGTNGKYLFPHTSGAEGTYTIMDFTDTGFTLLDTDSTTNGSGSTYIYLAIA